MDHAPDSPLTLDMKIFAKSPTAPAAGPGGCSNEMLEVCLDDQETCQLLFLAAEDFARGTAPNVSQCFMLANLTALQKKDGGVRGIITGTTFRRLVAKTLARQFSRQVEAACAPFQFALSTRAGVDCVGHADCEATLPINGVGAYDHVFRSSILAKLLEVLGLRPLLPLVRSIYARPSRYVWQDDAGQRHEVHEHEGRDAILVQLGDPQRSG